MEMVSDTKLSQTALTHMFGQLTLTCLIFGRLSLVLGSKTEDQPFNFLNFVSFNKNIIILCLHNNINNNCGHINLCLIQRK